MGNRNQSVEIPKDSQLFNDRMENNYITYQENKSQCNLKKIFCNLCCCKERSYGYEPL